MEEIKVTISLNDLAQLKTLADLYEYEKTQREQLEQKLKELTKENN